MSNDTEHRNQDQRLTDTYRAMANERAPDSLNEKILRLAAGRRTPYFRARAWMRPLAWAATIGLSLAIVLEMTRLPQVEPDSTGIAAPENLDTDDLGREISTMPSDNGVPAKTAIAPHPATPGEQIMDAERARPRVPAADRLSSDKLVPKDMSVLRDAEDMARAQAGSDVGTTAQRAEIQETMIREDLAEELDSGIAKARPAAIESTRADEEQAENRDTLASFAAMTAAEPAVALPHCGESVRRQPETWIACIRGLEENGQDEEALSEYAEFHRAFPDFDTRDAEK